MDKNQKSASGLGGILARFGLHPSRTLTAELDDVTGDYTEHLSSRNKNTLGLVLASVLLVLMAAFVVLIGWQRQFADAYLATNVSIRSFDNSQQEWFVTSATESECVGKGDCYEYLKQKSPKVMSYENLLRPWREFETDSTIHEAVYILVRTTIEKQAWKSLHDAGHKQLVIGLPSAIYDDASVYLNDRLVGSFIKSSRIGVGIHLKTEPQGIEVGTVYQKQSLDNGLFDRDDEPLLIATPLNYNAWIRVLVMQSAQRGSWLSNLSFIVMSVFFLLLYLLVDRSPEVLGLALFVGLDAFARSLWYDWLPTVYTPQIADLADSAAQIMRLYFMVQLCRFGSANVAPWLGFAFFYSLIVSAGSWAQALGWPIIEDRVAEINSFCQLIVAGLGTMMTTVTIYKIRHSKQTWRKFALIVAMLSCILYATADLHRIFTDLGNSVTFLKMRSILIPLSVFLLASSAFVNISTLENRVQILSDVKIKSDEIKKELELGRVVQNAYMKVPALPPPIDLACFFEAAFYVSGDAYFVQWEESTKRFTVIVGDVTGHGVQAALKASTLQVIARTIFRDPVRRSGNLGSRFLVYEQALRAFLRDSWGEGDLPTFLGIELELTTGKVTSHRSNFPFPMIVEQRDDGRWIARVWTDQVLALDSTGSGRKIFFVAASDGVISGSKMFHKVARDLEKKLNDAKLVSAELIKQEILESTKHVQVGMEDDRTMLVFGVKRNQRAA